MNIDENMLNNLKNMFGEDQLNSALFKISPEMVENFSKMMSNSNNNQENTSSTDSGNIDLDTMLKIKSILEKMNNNKNDPRSNLLNSLRPYMRDSRKENIDKYTNLLKMADLASLFSENNKKENYPND